MRHKFWDTLEKHYQKSYYMINTCNLFHISKRFALLHISYRNNIKKIYFKLELNGGIITGLKIIKMTEIFNCLKCHVFSKMKIFFFLSKLLVNNTKSHNICFIILYNHLEKLEIKYFWNNCEKSPRWVCHKTYGAPCIE